MPPDPARAAAWQRIKNNKRRDEVLSILRDLEPFRDEWEFSNAIQACGAVGDAHRARTLLLDEMPRRRIRPSVYCFNACIKAVGNKGQWTDALKLLDEMDAVGVKPTLHSFSAALSAMDKASEPDRAVRLLKKVERPDSYCYCPVIHARYSHM